MHWSFAVHAAPRASLLVQSPTGRPAQKLPVEQSPSPAHVVRQAAPPSHLNAPQLDVVVCVHEPPLHVPATVSVELVAGQDAGAHVVPVGYVSQAPWPLHEPSVPQLGAP
jgi:hypothetical protein